VSTGLVGSAPLAVVLFVGIALIVWSYQSIVVNGLGFFTTTLWDPKLSNPVVYVNGFPTLAGSSYGVLVFVTGTLLTSGMALLFAVPAGLGIAIFLTQLAPRRIAASVTFLIQLLAGIPSVLYGFWGFIALRPFLITTVEPFLSDRLSFIPIFAGEPRSAGLLSSALILGLMAVPIIASISSDVMYQTPLHLKEGARALGLTNWEVTRKIVIPSAKAGIVGSAVLGLGRVLGESMAVAMVSGTSDTFPTNLYSSVNTIAAKLVLSLNIASSDPSGMNISALMELASVLLAITVVVNIVARLIVRQGFATSADSVVRL